MTFWCSGGHGGAPDAPPAKRTHLVENCKPFIQAWQASGCREAGKSASAAIITSSTGQDQLELQGSK